MNVLLSVRELSEAVRSADVERARRIAAEILGEREQDSKLTSRKVAFRAERFRLEGERVLFEIERHPGLSFLTHRRQTWAIGPDGSFDLVAERLERINLARLADAATRTEATQRHANAAAALEYANELARQDGDAYSIEDVAIGWVASATWGYQPRGRFPGTIAAMVDALNDGVSSRSDRLEEARGISLRARAIWTELRSAVSSNETE